MDEKKLMETLNQAYPETPAVFHERLMETAEGLKRKEKKMKSKYMLRMALACLLVLSLTGGALAAMNHYGVLNFRPCWPESHYFTLPGAEKMIHYDLARVKTGNLTWFVKEAAYDGRVLRILYSVRFDSAAVARTDEDAYSEYMNLLSSSGVYLECDGTGEIFVNGRGVNLSSTDARYGEENGEIECWVDCRLEGYGDTKLRPRGEIAVSMPFHFTDEKVKAASEKEALEFTMDVGDAALQYALKLPRPAALRNGAVVEITDLHFSPVTVFIDGKIHLPDDRVQDMPEENTEAFLEWLDALPEAAMLTDIHLENADGAQLGEYTDGYFGHTVKEDGSLDLIFRYEGTPSEKYSKVNYLCLGEWKVPIPMEYQNP